MKGARRPRRVGAAAVVAAMLAPASSNAQDADPVARRFVDYGG